MPGQWSAPANQSVQVLVASALTGTGPATGVDITDYEGQLEFLLTDPSPTLGSGTMTVTLETSDTLGSGYVTAKTTAGANATFTNISASTSTWVQRLVCSKDQLKRYVRFNATISGSSPSHSTTLVMTGTKKVV